MTRQGDKGDQPSGGATGKGKSNIYNQHYKTNEMVLGRAYQPPQRRPMDLACYHLQTIIGDKGDQSSG